MSGGAEDARWRQLTLGLFGQPPPSFDSFFAGANGEAVRAVQHWAAGGAGPWCVLLWGAPGAGKSHLLQAALGAADAAGASCMYLPLTEALRHGAGLLDGLDALTALCLDDVDAVAGLPEWETALFALYNGLQARGHRLLVSAVSNPQHLPLGLPDLRSRLSAALVDPLLELNDEDKAQALMAAAARLGMSLPESVAAHLLRRLPRDWRALHTALEQLNEASLSAGRALTLPFVRATLALTD